MKKNDIVTIEITGMTAEGNGVGRYENIAVFVPFTAVGDIVSVKIVKVQKNFCYGIIDKIISPSEDRTENSCEVFGKCGGCCFRHISYPAELKSKQDFVKDAFKRIGKINFDFADILGCSSDDFYRNKAQYPVAAQNGQAICGFFSKRSHRVIPYTSCRLQPEIFQKIVDTIIDYVNTEKIPAYNEEDHTGILRHIYIRQGYHSHEIMVCLITRNDKTDFSKLINLLTYSFPNIRSIVMNINPHKTNVILGEKNILLYGSETISDIMCGNQITLSPFSFYQINTEQAEKLYGIVSDYCGLGGKENIMDLYCGAGTIGLSLADRAKKLIGVEIISEAIENAEINAQNNGISNTEFICADAGKAAAMLAERSEKPDIIIVDPPRKGCDTETLDAIAKMSPKKLVMVSCNPATAARDCAYMLEKGYKLVKGQAVDMFPRTGHVECVVLMSRANK